MFIIFILCNLCFVFIKKCYVILIIALYLICFMHVLYTANLTLYLFSSLIQINWIPRFALHQLYQYASKYYDGVGVVAIRVCVLKDTYSFPWCTCISRDQQLTGTNFCLLPCHPRSSHRWRKTPAAQSKQLTLRLQQIAAALENKVTDSLVSRSPDLKKGDGKCH